MGYRITSTNFLEILIHSSQIVVSTTFAGCKVQAVANHASINIVCAETLVVITQQLFMDNFLREKLIQIAREKYRDDDPSHDFGHILRVLSNAENIVQEENADMDIVLPAVLFHDVINYPKNSPQVKFASDESAEIAKNILENIPEYSQEKIPNVVYAISVCSFNKGIIPDTLEAKIVQDADGLEATGAISIMRTYASTGQMKKPFYNIDDPFCENREPNAHEYALDLFYQRLLKIKDRCHTKKAKRIAERRTHFLLEFLKEFEQELKGE